MTQSILIVDDDESSRISVELALTMAGYSVLGADSGSKAIEHITAAIEAAETFDLLITDLHMPEMSGQQLIDELDRLGIEIPTIVLTGYADPDAIENLGGKNGCELFEKPLDPRALTIGVEKVLSKNKNRKRGWRKSMLPPNPFRLAEVENAFNTIRATDG